MQRDLSKYEKAFDMRHAAQVLKIDGVGGNLLFEFLRYAGVLGKGNIPKESYLHIGYFEIRYGSRNPKFRSFPKTMITESGLKWLIEEMADKIREWANEPI